MSSFIKETKHPKTGKWEKAEWIDNCLGNNHYCVEFPSDRNEYMYDPEIIKLETREYPNE